MVEIQAEQHNTSNNMALTRKNSQRIVKEEEYIRTENDNCSTLMWTYDMSIV